MEGDSSFSRSDQILASLILKYIPRLGARSWKRLYETFDSPIEALEKVRLWADLGISRISIEAVGKKEIEKRAKEEYRRATSLGFEMLSLWERGYPSLLKEIIDPPILLYIKGNFSLITLPKVAIVGTRQASRAGKNFAFSLAQGLSRAGVCVVSGLARGIDACAHKGALKGAASTLAVLGTGLDVNYPYDNRELKKQIEEKGLLISEFPPNTSPSPENFPMRNRIISGLSLGVVVVEAAKKSGSLITARRALEQNRLVFAVPGSPLDKMVEGNNLLLREGAILVRNQEDIIEEISPMVGEDFLQRTKKVSMEDNCPSISSKVFASSLEQRILDLVQQKGRCTIDEIIELLDCDASTLLSYLVMMEIKGYIKKTGYGYEVL